MKVGDRIKLNIGTGRVVTIISFLSQERVRVKSDGAKQAETIHAMHFGDKERKP